MVGQQEFHDTFTSLCDQGRIGKDVLTGHGREGTRGNWLGCTLGLDQAHSTISSDQELSQRDKARKLERHIVAARRCMHSLFRGNRIEESEHLPFHTLG
jgi:hypothetical protein